MALKSLTEGETDIMALDVNNEIRRHIVDDSVSIMEIVRSVTQPYTVDIDALMDWMSKRLGDDINITDEELATFLLKLTAELYRLVDPNLGIEIKEEVSKLRYKNEYAHARLTQSEGTVAERDNAAFLATQDSAVLQLIYREANHSIKARYDRASEMVMSIKRVMSYRVQQMGGVLEQ